MGDLFARTTPNADLVQITRNPTPLNPNQVRLRITATIGNYSASEQDDHLRRRHERHDHAGNLTIPAEFYGEAGDDYLSGAMNNDWLVGGTGQRPDQRQRRRQRDLGRQRSDDSRPIRSRRISAVGGDDTSAASAATTSSTAAAAMTRSAPAAATIMPTAAKGTTRSTATTATIACTAAPATTCSAAHAGNDLLSGGDGRRQAVRRRRQRRAVRRHGHRPARRRRRQRPARERQRGQRRAALDRARRAPARTARRPTRNGADNDAALLTLLTQWGTLSNRGTLGIGPAITHDGVNDDLFGGTGDDDFCWETADVLDNPPASPRPTYNASGMGTDERFGPT